MMTKAMTIIAAAFAVLVFVGQSTAWAATPDGRYGGEMGADSQRAESPALVWGDVRLPTIGYATRFITENGSTPTIGVGAGLTVKPWEHWGLQGRAHLQGTVSFFGEETGSCADLTLMLARIESGQNFHASFGAGPSYLSGRATARDDETRERTPEPYTMFGVGAEGQVGVHLGRFTSFTLIASGVANLEGSYVVVTPTLQIGGLY